MVQQRLNHGATMDQPWSNHGATMEEVCSSETAKRSPGNRIITGENQIFFQGDVTILIFLRYICITLLYNRDKKLKNKIRKDEIKRV